VKSGDVDLFVRDIGAGGKHPLVMVHGGPDWDHSYLLPAARRIARDRRVILFDLRGCGRSGRPKSPAGYSIDAAAEDLLVVIRSAGGRAHVLGFSFGGRVAIRAAQIARDAFASLILASTTPGGPVDWRDEPTERIRRRRGLQNLPEAFAEADEIDAALTKRLALDGLPLDVWNLDRLPEFRQVLETVRFSAEWGKALHSGVFVPDRVNHIDWLKSVNLPKLVLHGAHDFRFPVTAIDGLRGARITRVEIIEEAGHLAPLECPEQWSAAVSDFLDARNPPRR